MKQNYKNKFFHLAGLLFFAFTVNAQVTTFIYTGGVQTYMVPAGVTSVNIKTWGAQGVNGGGAFGGEAGLGGYADGVDLILNDVTAIMIAKDGVYQYDYSNPSDLQFTSIVYF